MERETPPTGPLGAEPLEQSIGPYRVLGELGRGGQCVVYLAEDARLRRRVALKVLPRGVGTDTSELLRFRREAEVVARLDHPGICPVLETGESDGAAWIAMRLVEGETLARRIEALRGESRAGITGWLFRSRDGGGEAAAAAAATRRPPSSREDLDALLLLFERVARALHAAHEAGLVHRDVKPGNIMVTPTGDPVLLDFGVAREDAPGSHTLTRTGAILGTPPYIAPEVLRPERGPADRRADVWSLGVTVYEAFTLALPFDAPTLDRMFHRILLSDPEDPARMNPSLPRDLGTVLATALEKDPARRYQTALAFAEELGRVRRGEPIVARTIGPWTRAARWAGRNPALAASLGTAFAALAAGLGASLYFLAGRGVALETAGRALSEKDAALGAAREAQARTEEALAETREALRRNRALALASASAAAEDEDPVRAVLLAREARRAADLPETLARLRDALRASRERALLASHGRRVAALAWSPAGDRLATGGEDNAARLWDAAGREIAVLRGHRQDVTILGWSADGSTLLTASPDGTARLWDRLGVERAAIRPDAGPIVAASIAPDGRSAATGHENGAVRRWNADGTPAGELRGLEGRVTALVHSADGGLAAGDATGRVVLRPADAPDSIPRWGFPSPVSILRFARDGRILAGLRDGTAALLAAAGADTGSTPIAGHEGPITDAAVAPDGSFATASEDRTARLWGADGVPGPVLRGHTGSLSAVAFDPTGERVLTASRDGTVRAWDRGGRERFVLRGHRGPVGAAAFAPIGQAIATASEDGTARIWDAGEPEFTDLRDPAGAIDRTWFASGGRVVTVVQGPRTVLRTWDGEGRPVRDTRIVGNWHVAWSSTDADRLLVGIPDRFYLRLLDGDGAEIAVQKGYRDFVVAIPGTESLLVPDGGELRLVDGRTGAARRIHAQERHIRSVAPAPGGREIAVVSDDGAVSIIDLEGRVLRDLGGGGEQRSDHHLESRFSGDGTRLVTEDPHRRIRVIDPRDGRVLSVAGRDSSARHSPEFHPSDASLLATVWADGLLEVAREGAGTSWSFGQPPAPRVRCARWSASGETIAVGCEDGTVRILGSDGAERAVVAGLGDVVRFVEFSPDGGRILAHVGGEARVRSLGPLDPEVLASARVTRDFTLEERRAHREILGEANRVPLAALEALAAAERATPDPEEAAEAIRSDPSLEPAVREAALAAAAGRPPDPNQMNRRAWDAIVLAGRPDARRTAGLRWAEKAAALEPESGPILNTLGVAQYRNGRIAEADATLRLSDRLNRGWAPRGVPADSLFLALTSLALGRPGEARSWYDLAREQMEDPRQAEVQYGYLMREVESALGLGAAPPR